MRERIRENLKTIQAGLASALLLLGNTGYAALSDESTCLSWLRSSISEKTEYIARKLKLENAPAAQIGRSAMFIGPEMDDLCATQQKDDVPLGTVLVQAVGKFSTKSRRSSGGERDSKTSLGKFPTI
jgi:hypothetical protein